MCTNFPLTMTNIVVYRTSYSDFVRLVFLDGGFLPIHKSRMSMTYNRNTLLHLPDVSMRSEYHHTICIASASVSSSSMEKTL